MPKLTDLNAKIIHSGTHIEFECPCEKCDHMKRLVIPFQNPLGGGQSNPQGWQRRGETIETMTLRPSIKRMQGCQWHGFITDGEARKC